MSDDERGTSDATRPAYFAAGVTAGQQRVLDLLKRRGDATIPVLAASLELIVESPSSRARSGTAAPVTNPRRSC